MFLRADAMPRLRPRPQRGRSGMHWRTARACRVRRDLSELMKLNTCSSKTKCPPQIGRGLLELGRLRGKGAGAR